MEKKQGDFVQNYDEMFNTIIQACEVNSDYLEFLEATKASDDEEIRKSYIDGFLTASLMKEEMEQHLNIQIKDGAKRAAAADDFLAVEFELAEDYKAQIIIQQFRGNEPIKRTKLQKQLKEKYLSLFIKKLKKYKKQAHLLFEKHITKEDFLFYESSIDWTTFEKGGKCANNYGLPFINQKYLSKEKETFEDLRNMAVCQEQNRLICSRCKTVSYCSKECSIVFWPYHSVATNSIEVLQNLDM